MRICGCSPSLLALQRSGWGYGCTNYAEDIRARICAVSSHGYDDHPQSAGCDWWMGVNVPVNPRSCDCTLSDVVGLGAGTRGFRLCVLHVLAMHR